MHKFNLIVNNIQRFVLNKNNIHRFIIESEDATDIMPLDLDMMDYCIRSDISSKDITLNMWDVPLSQLPQDLRTFVGAYVYVRTRMKTQASQYMSNTTAYGKLGLSIHSHLIYGMDSAISSIVVARIGFNGTTYRFTTTVDSGIAIRTTGNEDSYNNTTEMSTKASGRIRMTFGYKSNVKQLGSHDTMLKDFEGYALKDLPEKLSTFVRSSLYILARLKPNGNNIKSGSTTDGTKIITRVKRNLSETEVTLKDLPIELIDFCYKKID